MDISDGTDGGGVGHAGVNDVSDMPAPSDVSAPSWMTTDEAGHYLGVSERQVRRYVKASVLDAERQQGPRGLRVMVSRESVEALHGQRLAIEQDDEDDAGDADITDIARVRGDAQALIAGLADRLEAQYAARLADKAADVERLTGELGRVQEIARAQAEALGHERARREAAEAELERERTRQTARTAATRRARPWWIRLLGGAR